MNKNATAPFLFGALLIASAAGCAGPATGGESVRASADAPAAKTAGAAPSPAQPPAVAGDTPAAVAAGQSAAPVNPQADASAQARPGPGPAPRARTPEPEVGTGGNDLFLFTRVRAAVAGAAELQGADVTLNVSDGVVILSGTVPDEARKAKAAELARGVEGVRGVRNELRVARGGAARRG